MNVSTYIRAADWWSNKLPTLLSIGYATVLHSDSDLFEIAPYCLLILFSLIAGAAYVSLINDMTDISIDAANGKKNRMANTPHWARWFLILFLVLIGSLFCWILWPDGLSIYLYLLSWLTFSCYSIPPFRLKTRGWAGVLADACGAHLFPSLYFVSAISFRLAVPVDLVWFIATGIWAFMHGLRGILWHQYRDRENDIITKTNTLATKLIPSKIHPLEIFVLVLEVGALVVMLGWINEAIVFIAAGLYLLSSVLGYYKYGLRPVIILMPGNKPFQIVMQEFYQSFLPFSLLLVASYEQPKAWIVLIVHLLLFPGTLRDIFRNLAKVFITYFGVFRNALKLKNDGS